MMAGAGATAAGAARGSTPAAVAPDQPRNFVATGRDLPAMWNAFIRS